jgi:hypothetical protein
MLASLAPAQEPAMPAAVREGTHVFRRILFEEHFQPISDFSGAWQEPAGSVLVLLGDMRRLPPEADLPGRLADFVRGGGALLLASDRPLPEALGATIANLTGVVIGDATVSCTNPESCYHGRSWCPLLRGADGRGPDLLHSSRGGDLLVATNTPAYLVENGWWPKALRSVVPVCYLPEGCTRDDNGRPVRPGLFGVAGSVGQGKVLVLADNSLFINEMTLRSDNNNVEFSYNCMRWLAEGAGGQRDRVLFVENGKIETLFEVPMKDVPDLSEEMLRRALGNLDRGLAQLEDNDTFNRGLIELLHKHGIGPSDVARVVLIAGSVALVAFGFVRLTGRARYRPEAKLPPLEQALVSGLPQGTVLAQRQRAILRDGNLWEAGRSLAREVFVQAGLPEAPHMPSLVIRGGWWQRWRWQRRVRRLWRLAFGPPIRIRPGRWQALLGELDQLRRALTDGTIRIADCGLQIAD